jgi:hypothetical protein
MRLCRQRQRCDGDHAKPVIHGVKSPRSRRRSGYTRPARLARRSWDAFTMHDVDEHDQTAKPVPRNTVQCVRPVHAFFRANPKKTAPEGAAFKQIQKI